MDEDLEQIVQRAEAEYISRFAEGPERLQWTELPPQIGDAAPDVQVRDSTGTARSLGEFWADRPALVLFWRHFGCGIGIERAVQLAQEYPDYVEAGANVVIIGEGEPAQAAAYATEHDLACPVLCDPTGDAHEAYGLLEFAPSQLLYWTGEEIPDRDTETAERVATEWQDMVGHPQVNNPWRQPGEFVVDSSGEIRLAYRYQYIDDIPDSQLLVTAIKQVV